MIVLATEDESVRRRRIELRQQILFAIPFRHRQRAFAFDTNIRKIRNEVIDERRHRAADEQLIAFRIDVLSHRERARNRRRDVVAHVRE